MTKEQELSINDVLNLRIQRIFNKNLSRLDEKYELIELIKQAIAEHEQSQWKKYPENKPDWDTKYWTNNKFGHECSCYGREFDAISVIAFRKLPKSYEEK